MTYTRKMYGVTLFFVSISAAYWGFVRSAHAQSVSSVSSSSTELSCKPGQFHVMYDGASDFVCGSIRRNCQPIAPGSQSYRCSGEAPGTTANPGGNVGRGSPSSATSLLMENFCRITKQLSQVPGVTAKTPDMNTVLLSASKICGFPWLETSKATSSKPKIQAPAKK